MVPLPPGRFSTTNGWPSWSPSFCASCRPTASSVPPGGKGMIIFTGRAGQAWARALAAPAARQAASASFSVVLNMVCLLGSGLCDAVQGRQRVHAPHGQLGLLQQVGGIGKPEQLGEMHQAARALLAAD